MRQSSKPAGTHPGIPVEIVGAVGLAPTIFAEGAPGVASGPAPSITGGS